MSTRSTKSQATPKSTKCQQKHLPHRATIQPGQKSLHSDNGCSSCLFHIVARDPFDQLLTLSIFEFIISLED
ncbi:hypothetical protein NXS19_001156 [Fusarium pseudograminearum]|nr:hypothetical protein NXS19_001156 [Fusarium pseudograminearum]